ncbi:MAG: hypothetical protein ACR2OZ_05995 [Verrucomicrobiales bacterium]
MALCSLIKGRSAHSLDHACARAMAQGAWRYRDLRRLLEKSDSQPALPFAESHPLIHDLQNYADFIQTHTSAGSPYP